MQLKTFCPFPVGYVYLSADGTSPGTLFPNTSWERIQDVFLLASGNRTAGDTGGSEDVTLTTDQIPSHSHSVGAHAHGLNGHTHSVGAHAHGLNSHTHTYAKPNSPTGGTAITVAQLAKHSHNPSTSGGNNGIWTEYGSAARGSGISCILDWGNGITISQTGSGSAHTHTIGTTSTNSGGPSTTNTANSAAFNSGTPSTANTANSAAFDSGAAGGGRLTATCRRTSRSTCGRGSRRSKGRRAAGKAVHGKGPSRG